MKAEKYFWCIIQCNINDEQIREKRTMLMFELISLGRTYRYRPIF